MNPFKRLLASLKMDDPPSPRIATSQSLVQMGIVSVGGRLELVHPDIPVRGVKLVTVTVELALRHDDVMFAYSRLQHELQALPKSLRPRSLRQPKPAETHTDDE